MPFQQQTFGMRKHASSHADGGSDEIVQALDLRSLSHSQSSFYSGLANDLEAYILGHIIAVQDATIRSEMLNTTQINPNTLGRIWNLSAYTQAKIVDDLNNLPTTVSGKAYTTTGTVYDNTKAKNAITDTGISEAQRVDILYKTNLLSSLTPQTGGDITFSNPEYANDDDETTNAHAYFSLGASQGKEAYIDLLFSEPTYLKLLTYRIVKNSSGYVWSSDWQIKKKVSDVWSDLVTGGDGDHSDTIIIDDTVDGIRVRAHQSSNASGSSSGNCYIYYVLG